MCECVFVRAFSVALKQSSSFFSFRGEEGAPHLSALGLSLYLTLQFDL